MEKTLLDYKEIFDEFFTGNDVKRIVDKTKLSSRTIYSYLNGSIPDSIAGKANSDAILGEALIIINEKKLKLEI